MQSRRAARGLISTASSNLGERDEFFKFSWSAWRALVSKAGSEPVQATGSKVEAEAAALAAGKKQILPQEYRSGMNPKPQLRKEVIGLYGYEILKTAKGFRIFAQDAIEK